MYVRHGHKARMSAPAYTEQQLIPDLSEWVLVSQRERSGISQRAAAARTQTVWRWLVVLSVKLQA